MKYNPEENFEEWTNKVQAAELDNARRLLAKGQPIEEVLEILSKRMMQKLLHPILLSIKDVKTNYDAEAERARYNEIYKNMGRVADHVVRDDEE